MALATARCVSRAPGGWTRVTPAARGRRVRVAPACGAATAPDCAARSPRANSAGSPPGAGSAALNILGALRRPAPSLPNGPLDLLRQIVLFCGAYWLYRLVRGLVDGRAAEAFDNARQVIDFERALGLFFEPARPRVGDAHAVVIDSASWMYVNSHFAITTVTLAWIYLRRNERFYFVRNMFMVAMGIALVGYVGASRPRRRASCRSTASATRWPPSPACDADRARPTCSSTRSRRSRRCTSRSR